MAAACLELPFWRKPQKPNPQQHPDLQPRERQLPGGAAAGGWPGGARQARVAGYARPAAAVLQGVLLCPLQKQPSCTMHRFDSGWLQDRLHRCRNSEAGGRMHIGLLQT